MEFLYALPLLVKAFILGIVEGLTEFLPISSTGHLILAGAVLGWSDQKAKLFDVAIQTGAMFAVIWYYRIRIGRTVRGVRSDPIARRFAVNILIAFVPAAMIGVLFASRIKAYLFKPVPVALAFIVGGLIIFWVEYRHRVQRIRPRVHDLDELTPADAVKLGIAQAFALIPGTSRSGAMIIGGMLLGLSRKTATEFSFFLAIPTLIGAGAYDTFHYRSILSTADIPLFAVGLTTAFFSALLCVHWLIRFVASHSFVAFAWYRIIFGVVVLLTAASGEVTWSA
jgi:undecaprenyl-diphosphatase